MPPTNCDNARGALHPARQAQTEDHLDRRGISYTFEPNYPIDRIRSIEGHQVRLDAHRAPKEMVDRYVEQMRQGATFPGIVINDAGELVDGNTRLAAKERLGKDTVAAYVCDSLTPVHSRGLSVELNLTHGLSMDEDEIKRYVVTGVRDGAKFELSSLSRMTGVKKPKLMKWIKAEEGRARIAKAGLMDQYDLLPETVQAALMGARLQQVFVNVTRLAIDARLNQSAVKTIITHANDAPSESEALIIISAAREELAEQISTRAAGFTPVQRRGQRATMHLAALTHFSASDLIDLEPDKIPDAIDRMQQVHTQLGLAIHQFRNESAAGAGAEMASVGGLS